MISDAKWSKVESSQLDCGTTPEGPHYSYTN
jgi:hypothetical protein